jgi:thymidylate synthase
LKEASEKLNIHPMTIKGRLKSSKFDNYKYSSVSPHMMDTIKHEHIVLENYQSHPTIKAPFK